MAKVKEAVEEKGTQETKDVAVATVGAVALPDYMKKYAGAGGEHADASKLEIPRIQLLQALSPQVESGEMKAGSFFHSVTEEELPPEMVMIPLLFRSQFILWNPRENGGGILARADDGKHWTPPDAEFSVKIDKKTTVTWKTKPTVQESGLANWGTYNPNDAQSQPAATEMYVFLVVFPERPDLGVAALSLQRSQISPARKLLTALKLTDYPFFGQKFVMKSVSDTNSNNQDFRNFKFVKAGLVSEQDFPTYASLYEKFAKTDFVVKDLEAAQDEGNSPSGQAPLKADGSNNEY